MTVELVTESNHFLHCYYIQCNCVVDIEKHIKYFLIFFLNFSDSLQQKMSQFFCYPLSHVPSEINKYIYYHVVFL